MPQPVGPPSGVGCREGPIPDPPEGAAQAITRDTSGCNHRVARPNCPCCTAEIRAISSRLNADLSRRGFLAGATGSEALLGLAAHAPPATASVPPQGDVLFQGARLFDGLAPTTRPAMSVLVRAGMIAEVTGSRITPPDRIGATALADGRDAVLRATREQLMQGASQIKITAGGGASSLYDPLDTTQFLPEEIEAAVLAAADWGTYVCAHVYTPTGIQRCLRAGVRSIEHGQLADETSVMMMADAGAAWSQQPFTPENADAEGATPQRLAKLRQVWEGTDRAYALAIRHGVATGFGTDILFNAAAAERQGQFLADMTRWYTPGQALKQATSDNAFILGLSGLRNPYPEGRLGVIEAGAHADILLVDGDPTENLELVRDPDADFRVIMKAGRVFKNTV